MAPQGEQEDKLGAWEAGVAEERGRPIACERISSAVAFSDIFTLCGSLAESEPLPAWSYALL